ncbi:MAG: hypothetical protein EHM33_25455 [Chloroflexi bacterium]|nr:MAG: hypothetical protein EHM33_25455 [Chloroflexota bacterium]
MSIMSLKHTKKYTLNIDLLFALFALTLALLILVPSNENLYISILNAPGALDRPRATLLTSGDVSFAADQQYWAANCGQEWSSDARCNSIVARTQSCSTSAASGYCSEYKNYLREYLNR